MKILFDTAGIPFYLAHGGAKTQILSTINALRDQGVEVEYAKWWDPDQKGDLIHSFGTPGRAYLTYASKRKTPVVNTTLFTASCNRPNWKLDLTGKTISAISAASFIPPVRMIKSQFKWDSFPKFSANVVGLQAEVDVLTRMYGVDRKQIHLVPLGLAPPFLNVSPGPSDSEYLVTTGTITPRKRSLELAEAAHAAGTPIRFVGKPYDENEDYWHKFKKLVDGKTVTHISHTESISEMVEILRSARGFVIASDYENWCLSAHEAAACGLPLLLPNQRWSKERFGTGATYFPIAKSAVDPATLKHFYNAAPSLKAPQTRHHSWQEVAQMLKVVYEQVLS